MKKKFHDKKTVVIFTEINLTFLCDLKISIQNKNRDVGNAGVSGS